MKMLSGFLSLGTLFLALSPVAEAKDRCRQERRCEPCVTYTRPAPTYYYVPRQEPRYTYTRTTYTEIDISISYRSTSYTSFSSRGGYSLDW